MVSQNIERDAVPPGPLQKCRQAGFLYAAFISWPHRIQSRGGEIIAALHQALADRFEDEGGGRVFLDQMRHVRMYYATNRYYAVAVPLSGNGDGQLVARATKVA